MPDKPQLTDQQAAAIETRDVSIALSAGAGCGKTFVLTQRFLTHLQPGSDLDDLHQIVAITFTDRAAREMRDRIREACRNQLKQCAQEEVPHWLEIIRGIDSARISTIHSFCASLLRSHAVDAGIDPGFGLLEETSGGSFLRLSVSDAVNELLSNRDEDCMKLVREYGLERTRELLRSLVTDRFRIDDDRFAETTPETLAVEWLSRWHNEFVPRLLLAFVESEETKKTLQLLGENETSHDEMRRRQQFLIAQLPLLPTSTDPTVFLVQLREHAQVKGGGGKKAWDSEDVYDGIKNGFTRLRKEIDELTKLLAVDKTNVDIATSVGMSALKVARKVGANYEASKQEAALLDFDDLLIRTRDLLRNSSEVRNRAAAGIRFLMVDEFQDTDPVQTEIVQLLCGNELLSGKLFLVGDAKQSIYRFRHADPAVFHELRNRFFDRGRLPLSTNFRSQPEILNFVNCIFEQSMGDSYEALRPHKEEQLSPTPAIEFLFASPDVEAEGERAEHRRKEEADWIARRIKSLLDDDTPRIRQKNQETGADELRPAQPGDFAILFRSLNNVGLYEEALRKYGIDYYLVGGRAFYAQQEVFDLVNLCQFLDDPDDEVALAGVLRSPFFSLSDDALFAMKRKAGSISAALQVSPSATLEDNQQRQIRHASNVLNELHASKDRISLVELLNLALEQTGYDAALLNEFLGRRKLANLRKLIDMARQFDQSGLFTLRDFVVHVRESVAEQSNEELAATHPETSDVVRLMTIHKSKGLEFPVVVVADMDWKPQSRRGQALMHPELGALLSLPKLHGQKRDNLGMLMHRIEERPEDEAEVDRLLYVATTRAADYLILSACLPSHRKPTSPWLKLLSRRFDLSTGLPAGDPYLGKLSLGNVQPGQIPKIRVHHQPPEIAESRNRSVTKELPLSEFRSAIETAESVELPMMLHRFPVDTTAKRRFSVSEIEQVDAELRPRSGQQTKSNLSGTQKLKHDPANFLDSGGAEQLGTLVHSVLERIDFRDPANLEILVETHLRADGKKNDNAVRDVAVARLEVFLANPVAVEIATANDCFRELEFLISWPTKIAGNRSFTIVGTIDCLYQSDDGCWNIVDYKTGRHLPGDSDVNILDEYEIQLGLYSLAVREFVGRLPDAVRLALLQDDVRLIPFELSELRLADIISRVDNAIAKLRGQVDQSEPALSSRDDGV